jgi:hypothetical protein
MRRLLESSRFRRKVAWLGAFLAVAGLVAFLVVRFGNTGHPIAQTFVPGAKPQLVARSPKPDVFTAAERRDVRAVAVRFIESAVYRRNVDDAWEIVTPGLRQGLSRSAWASGSIPVVPYQGEAVREVRWKVNYSYANDVALKVAFYPKPASGVDRQAFDIELENHGTEAAPRWLVSYWAPSGGPQLQAASPMAPPVPGGEVKAQLGAIWLLVPLVVIVGSLLAVIVFLAARGRMRRTRAERLYSSRTSPS